MTDRAREILRSVYETDGSRLYPPPPPTAHDLQWSENPDWCLVAGRLVTWGRKLQPWAARNPRPETIAYAKYQLEDRYWQLYHRTTDEHRKDATSATHPCLHLALLTLREELEDVQFNAPIMVSVRQREPRLPKEPQVRRQNRRDPEELRSTYQQSYW
jgi:hypothetical protein